MPVQKQVPWLMETLSKQVATLTSTRGLRKVLAVARQLEWPSLVHRGIPLAKLRQSAPMAVRPRWVESREQPAVPPLAVLRSGPVVKWLLAVGLLDQADTVRVASRQRDLGGLGPASRV